MPNRELREGFLSSEHMASLTAEEERMFLRLLSCADDFGRFDGRPMMVKSRAFPLADIMAGVTLDAVTNWMNALHHKRMIRLYEVQSKPYLLVLRWSQRVRANTSKYPPPPDDCPAGAGHIPGSRQAHDGHSLSSASEDRGVNNEERGARSEGSARARATRTPIPPDFSVSAAVAAWAAQRGIDPAQHLEAFRLKCQAKGYAYADWDRAFMEAIRANWADVGATKPIPLGAAREQRTRSLAGRFAESPQQGGSDAVATGMG